MDPQKQMGEFRFTARSATWNEFITFILDDIFGKEISDFVRAYQSKIKTVGERETTFDFALEDWEWRLFETADAVKAYLRNEGSFMPQYRFYSLGQVAQAMMEIFWSVIKLVHPELWRPDNIGVRLNESGEKVVVGFSNSNEGISFGPFKFVGPSGPQQ